MPPTEPAAERPSPQSEGEPRRRRPVWINRRSTLLAALVVLVALCAGICLLIAVASRPPTASSAPGRLPVTVCAGVAVRPAFQIGIVWVSPISSYLPPLVMSDYAVCARIPDPGLPRQPWGGWVFPP